MTFKQYNPQTIFKEYNKETKEYKYITKIYCGGKEGKNVYIGKPVKLLNDTSGYLYPNEARLRDLSYSADIFADVLVEYTICKEGDDEPTVIEKIFEKVELGRIPIMLQSNLCLLSRATKEMKREMGECPYDQRIFHYWWCRKSHSITWKKGWKQVVYCFITRRAVYSAQIKSTPNDTFKYARTTGVNIHHSTNAISLRLPMIHKQIPLFFIMFRALGVTTDKEILETILYNLDSDKSKVFMEELRPSLEEACSFTTQEQALRYIAALTQGKR